MSDSALSRYEIISIGMIALMAVAGAALAPSVFPELAVWRSVLGGGLLGAFSGLCAVMHRFFE